MQISPGEEAKESDREIQMFQNSFGRGTGIHQVELVKERQTRLGNRGSQDAEARQGRACF